MNIKLKIWRQEKAQTKGRFEKYEMNDVSPEMSFPEMIDALNTRLIKEGKEPIAYDSDCREGICGTCGLFINGRPHGPEEKTTSCELHLR